MEYLVPLLIMIVVVIVVVAGARSIGKRNRTAAAPVQGGAAAPNYLRRDKGREITREDAAAASARLSPESHRLIYSLIAQHQILKAVKEYRSATRGGLGESAAAVAALAQFPQPTPEPVQPTTPGAVLTVEDIINAAPDAALGPVSDAALKPATVNNAYRFRAIVSQGDEVREVASTQLNEEIFGRIRELAQSGDYDEAARVLREHADIGAAEAMEFVSMIGPEED